MKNGRLCENHPTKTMFTLLFIALLGLPTEARFSVSFQSPEVKPTRYREKQNLPRFARNNYIETGDSYFLYKYGSYPPPLPLWAISKPRRKFVPYFGLDQTTKPPTTTTTQEPTPSCQHLPPSCWSTPQYLPLPLNCIDICSLDSVSTLQPTLSTCSTFPSGNLPLQCIQIIEALLRKQPSSLNP
eukprot:TRINITY_DN27599_c0_g1_i1.p1 TRINITY_DN27599_c0_g1~~TRINITY_DN27599_c0_g1_i1.p1  ORF type:complete len:185 (-),score=42.79 TRINITY_DN27599_c0_g1_i1:94-648(-)